MTDITQPRRKITSDEFYRLYEVTKQKIELINGDVVVPTRFSKAHQSAIENLSMLLTNFTIEHNLGEVNILATDIWLDDHNVLQPDLYFVAHDNPHFKRRGQYWQGAPDLCVEALSPYTVKRDRKTKPAIYAEHGVREYWILDPENAFVEVYRLYEDQYEVENIYEATDTFSPLVLPGLRVRLADIFAVPPSL